MGGFGDYISLLNERLLSSLPNGENEAFRVSREVDGGMDLEFYMGKEEKNMKKMMDQGFIPSSSPLSELGIEVQHGPCTKVSSPSSTLLLKIGFQNKQLLWENGHPRSYPHSFRLDIVTCPALVPGKLPTVFYRVVPYDREVIAHSSIRGSFRVFFRISFHIFFRISFRRFLVLTPWT